MHQVLNWLKQPAFAPEAVEAVEAVGEEDLRLAVGRRLTPRTKWPETPELNSAIKGLVTAVVTAIGLVGLLAGVGGAVTWLRVRQIGLPAQTALSVTDKADLVALGATGLVIYVGLALLLIAALYAVDPGGYVTGATLAVAGLLAVGVVGYVALISDFKGGLSRTLLVVAAIALVGACLRIGRSSGERRFVPFGVAVFFAVLVFGALVTYRSESDHPKVQPVAVLRGAEKQGLVGFLVAATDDKVYIARLARGARPGALYDLKRDASTRLAVGRRIRCESGNGPGVKCAAAAKAAVELRKQLLADRRKTSPAPTAPKKAKKAKTKKTA